LRAIEHQVLLDARPRFIDRGLQFLEQVHAGLEIGIHFGRGGFGHRTDRREVGAQFDEGGDDHVELRGHRLACVRGDLDPFRCNAEQNAGLVAARRELLSQECAGAGARWVETGSGLGHGSQDTEVIGCRL